MNDDNGTACRLHGPYKIASCMNDHGIIAASCQNAGWIQQEMIKNIHKLSSRRNGRRRCRQHQAARDQRVISMNW